MIIQQLLWTGQATKFYKSERNLENDVSNLWYTIKESLGWNMELYIFLWYLRREQLFRLDCGASNLWNLFDNWKSNCINILQKIVINYIGN